MSKPKRRLLAEINVVPYIDVMLVLLVIFMITAPLLTQGIDVNLPRAQARALDSKQKEPVVVSVDQQGNYYLNLAKNPSQPIATEDLKNQVASALSGGAGNEMRQVYVKGDQGVSYGKVVEVMVLLQQAGAKGVGLITKPK
jgi:biopolymer transport protein TolR